MSTDIAYIGLGSNLDRPYQQIERAITALDSLKGIRVISDSGFYRSKPMGPDDQPDYINAVVEIETELNAVELLTHCQSIEGQQGRIKTRHWGERCIDLDILLIAGQKIETDDLTVPHPGIAQRDFVYMPLLKINPEIDIPGTGSLSAVVSSITTKDTDYSCQYAGEIDR